MNKISLLKFFLMGATLLALFGCEQKSETAASGDKITRSNTLYMAGFQWGPPNTFNPLTFSWLSAFPVNAQHRIMYEPLMVFNTLTGDMEPILAQSVKRTNEVISVIMDPRAKWSDGKPLTAEDVVWTYEIGKEYPSAPTAYLKDWISKITVEKVNSADGQIVEKVNFVVNKKGRDNPLVIVDQLQAIRILPKHYLDPMIKKAGGLEAFTQLKIDKDPVVSGPYNLHSYAEKKIVLKRRDDYWGNDALHGGEKPKPLYIIKRIVESNEQASTLLQQGHLDVSANFIPRMWLKFKKGAYTWFKKKPYHKPATMPMLFMNHTKYPLSDRNFRLAMAHAINYEDVNKNAISSYSQPLRPGIILPFGIEKKYFSEEDAKKYGSTFNPEKAKAFLKKAGIKSVFGPDGKLSHMEDTKGKKLPTLLITSPAGWTDYESMVEIAVNSIRKVGIDIRPGFVDAGKYFSAKPHGEFDLLLDRPSPEGRPSHPWSRFDNLMASRNWAPIGERMNENEGRYNNPKGKNYIARVDQLLAEIPLIMDEAKLTEAYKELNRIFMQDQVTLPLAYYPEQMYQFSEKHWTNWANSENPYAPPQIPCFSVGTNMLWKIKAVK